MLGLLLNQVRQQAQAAAQVHTAQLQAAVAAQRAQLQAAQFQQQAQAASKKPLDPDIADLADHFNIEESLARWLDNVMQNRMETFEADIMTLWELLETVPNPAATLLDKIEELANGTFVTKTKTHKDIVKFCRKYELDHMATKNLIEALAVRERDHDCDTQRDMDKLAVHLEHSSAPSKLISMKLKELRGGCNIGAIWHCCGDSRKRREKVSDVPPEKSPGIEGVRDKCSTRRQGVYKSYTDHDLVQRFTASSSGNAAGLMTEEQAKNLQKKMRDDEASARQRRSSRSRSRRSRSRRRRSRSRSARRSRSRSRRRGGRRRD
mmetsp:Transcript_48052/g.134164  ORF Transcript_48052/g.134164 Transcript_48052/m.134164 type:complete len:321 (-) Transcript_48052:122-1084(-)